jgi:hypothetical protein
MDTQLAALIFGRPLWRVLYCHCTDMGQLARY